MLAGSQARGLRSAVYPGAARSSEPRQGFLLALRLGGATEHLLCAGCLKGMATVNSRQCPGRASHFADEKTEIRTVEVAYEGPHSWASGTPVHANGPGGGGALGPLSSSARVGSRGDCARGRL